MPERAVILPHVPEERRPQNSVIFSSAPKIVSLLKLSAPVSAVTTGNEFFTCLSFVISSSYPPDRQWAISFTGGPNASVGDRPWVGELRKKCAWFKSV